MKTTISLAFAGGLVILLLASQRSRAATCTSSTLVAPTVVEDTAGALLLAQAINCSGGTFNVSWVGSVAVEEPISVSDGTVLSVVGTPDGSSFVDGSAAEDSLFHVSSGTLRVSGLSLIDGVGEGGGAIYAIDSVLAAENCTLSGNTASSSGGAVHAQDSDMTFDHCTFSGNTASSSGGAVYAQDSNMTFDHCTFSGNNASGATGSGGAILVFASGAVPGRTYPRVHFVTLNRCTFSDNHAVFFGGAIYASGVELTSENSEFSSNHANSGGAVFIYSANVSSDNCTFSGNHAEEGGGAIHGDEWVFTSDSCTFSDNTCGNHGGAIYAVLSDITFSGNSVFKANQAGLEGGAIAAGAESDMTVSGTAVFESNHATGNGGGVSIVASELEVLVGGSMVFSRNSAEGSGGGMYVTASSMLVEGAMSYISNNASSGGGLNVVSSPEFQIYGTLFSSNSAETTGGAMSIISVGEEPNPVTASSCSFNENQAGDVGGAVFLAGAFIKMIGSDFDGNSAGRAGGAILASGIVTLDSCGFSDNHALLGPAVSNVVTVEVSDTTFTNNTRWCDGAGLFLDWKNDSAYDIACDACPVECSNCTTVNPDDVQLCESVIEHTTSPAVDGTLESLDLDPGYWRSSSTSWEVRECYEAGACVGGTSEYCGEGYKGPFCAVCAEGYTRGLGYACSECNGGRRNLTIGIALLLLVVAVVVGALSVRYLGSSGEEPAGWRIQARFKRSTVSQGLKIIIVSWQIIGQFSSVASVTYPDVYETFVGYIDVLDLDLTWMLSAECWVDTDFYDTLLAITIGPLVVSGLVLTSYTIRSRRCGAEDQDRHSRINHRHATSLFLVSFLVYSTASSTVFQTFACDDIDDGQSFLRADHSIRCYTTEHRVYMAYAGFMCLVYPFGIPFCYAATLYHARYSLKSDVESIRDTATVLRALHAPYRREVYYYEVVECFRRVTLSGIVVFILPNTAGQVMTTFLLSLFFFAVFMVLDPYTNVRDTWLARVGHGIVMMSMFVALVVKVDTEGDDEFSQDVFAGALVFVNGAMFLMVVAEALGMCSAVVREIRGPVPTTVVNGRGVEVVGIEVSPVG